LDRDLACRYGAVLGAEARRLGVDVLLSPTINLHRALVCGRHLEATPKHYVVNDSETERFTVDNRLDERPLRGAYLLAVRAGGVNGTTMSEHTLLCSSSADEWGFNGVVVCRLNQV
jgi:beta-glucosidase